MKELNIADYGLIGNSRGAALVSRYGSIDWCCLPEFDSPAVFAALLDNKKGGYFSIAPSVPFEAAQQYLPETNVLETRFETSDGKVRLVDCFTAMTEEQKHLSLVPDHEILRVAEGVSGRVKIKIQYAPSILYGKRAPRLRDNKKLGIRFSWKDNIYTLASTLAAGTIKVSERKDTASAEFDLSAGDQIIFSFSFSNQGPAILTELETTANSRMQNTIVFWRNWIGQCTYSGLFHQQVKRSALVLKLLTHAPSGAIIAAPTTSLPEKVGGDRNWDYRYCWLRDASFTTRALLSLGFKEETHAYMSWILHATQLTRPKLQVVYSVYGHTNLKEKILHWLSGYKKSTPVRIGNGAGTQFQVDVYGEVLDAVYSYSPLVKKFDRDSKRFIIGLGKIICRIWNQPDNGIWEIRGSPAHHTHSKVMAWVGLDRLIKLGTKYQWKEAELETFRNTAALIRKEVDEHGYNEELKTYTRELRGNDLDASLLVFPLVGFCDPQSERMTSTTNAIYDRLSKNNLMYRYLNVDDGLKGDEGAFGICNFWLAENFAKSGRLDKAMEIFQTMLQHAGGTGLLSEEVDPESNELLGNYPQGFTHIGLINAALSINKAYLEQRPSTHEY